MSPTVRTTIKHATVSATPKPHQAATDSSIPPTLALIAIFVLPIVAIIAIAVATKRAKKVRAVLPVGLITLLAILEPFIPPLHFSAAWIVIPSATVIIAWLICAELKRENLGERRQEGIENTLGEVHKRIADGLPQGSPKSRALTVSANLLGFLSYTEQKRIASEQSMARFGGMFGSLESRRAIAAIAGQPSPEEAEAREFGKEYRNECSTQVRDVYELLKQHGHESTEIEKLLELINPTAKDVRIIAEWLEQTAKGLLN